MLLAFKHLGAGKISCSAEMSMIFFCYNLGASSVVGVSLGILGWGGVGGLCFVIMISSS